MYIIPANMNEQLCNWTFNFRKVLRWGGRFYTSSFCSLSANVAVKELLKFINIWPNYCQNKWGQFFTAPQYRQPRKYVSLWTMETITNTTTVGILHSSRIRFLRFFENPKTRLYVFLKRHFKKNVKNVIQKSKFQTLLTFHYMESPLQFKNNVFLSYIWP